MTTDTDTTPDPILTIAEHLKAAIARLERHEQASLAATKSGDGAASDRCDRLTGASQRSVEALRFEALTTRATSKEGAIVQLTLAADLAEHTTQATKPEDRERAAEAVEAAILSALRLCGGELDDVLVRVFVGSLDRG